MGPTGSQNGVPRIISLQLHSGVPFLYRMPGGSCHDPSICRVRQCSRCVPAAQGSRRAPASSRPSRLAAAPRQGSTALSPKVKALWPCDEPAPGAFSQAEPVPTRAVGFIPSGSALSAPGLTFWVVTGWITLFRPASAHSGLLTLIAHPCHSGFSTCL